VQQPQPDLSDSPQLAQTVAQLARDASIELNIQDLKDLDASRAFLPRGKRVYVSHLPKQRWDETVLACQQVSAAGFDPIPHIPVRLIESESILDHILERLASAQVQELLLIAGDYAQPAGPYSAVADVLRAGKLIQHGFKRVSLAGHPEGHPTVPLEEIRRAEVAKASLAAPLETTYVTQFFFEASPFLKWTSELRHRGIRDARLIAGLAGPAGIATLLKFARRCGVGPSIRALIARPGSFAKLIGEHGPDDVMRELAAAYERDQSRFDGLHFFCFGGYLRTCEWLSRSSAVAGRDWQDDPE
jgi:methylenetetrahydrofolate reductase (NADPH)